ncbi:MAG: hypothetical protein H6712_13660 [Myxococcales bacterium]|nr:hypothetical protein [Myxococcales bacterium]MCB9714908.1 hypothetical protein [Myxococcales bacterium]
MADPFSLERTYVHLRPDQSAAPIEVDESFWATIATRTELHEGFLVTRARTGEDWPHWEMHPEGEEIVVLLSGAVDLVLDDGEREWTVELRPEAGTWINRRGVWHRAIVHEPSEMLFITAGRGTQHRPV